MRKVNFSLLALSSFLYSYSFPGIEEKTNSQKPDKLVFSQVKCHLLCFILIHREKVSGPGEMVFELEELIVPHVYSPCFAFVLRDLVLALRKTSFWFGDLTYNPEKNYISGFFLINNQLVMNFRWWT